MTALDAEHETALTIPGPLSLAILSVLWEGDRVRLNAILQQVSKNYKPVALSSVSTTITRLILRGWVRRTSTGMYTAAISRQELIELIIEHIEQA